MTEGYKVAVRKTNGLEIWFVSPREIYIKDKYGWQCFTRWGVRERYFWTKHWNPFHKALRDLRYLDMNIIRRLATLHDITIENWKLPEWVARAEVRIIPEKGRARNHEKLRSKFKY